MPKNDVELASAIAHLRQQLQEAMKEGAGKDLRFAVQDIEVELKCTVKKEAGVGGRVKFWVINADTKGTLGSENVQTVKLKLLPIGKDGKVIKLNRKGNPK